MVGVGDSLVLMGRLGGAQLLSVQQPGICWHLKEANAATGRRLRSAGASAPVSLRGAAQPTYKLVCSVCPQLAQHRQQRGPCALRVRRNRSRSVMAQ